MFENIKLCKILTTDTGYSIVSVKEVDEKNSILNSVKFKYSGTFVGAFVKVLAKGKMFNKKYHGLRSCDGVIVTANEEGDKIYCYLIELKTSLSVSTKRYAKSQISSSLKFLRYYFDLECIDETVEYKRVICYKVTGSQAKASQSVVFKDGYNYVPCTNGKIIHLESIK